MLMMIPGGVSTCHGNNRQATSGVAAESILRLRQFQARRVSNGEVLSPQARIVIGGWMANGAALTNTLLRKITTGLHICKC